MSGLPADPNADVPPVVGKHRDPALNHQPITPAAYPNDDEPSKSPEPTAIELARWQVLSPILDWLAEARIGSPVHLGHRAASLLSFCRPDLGNASEIGIKWGISKAVM